MKNYPDSGVYLLQLFLANKAEHVEVGALGKIEFPPGYYFYAGTAQKNLAARIKRHYSSDKKFHWHIDYLLDKALLENDFVFSLPREGECFLAELLKENGGKILADGFGASDCSCGSHLIYFPEQKGEKIVQGILNKLDLKEEFKKYKNRE